MEKFTYEDAILEIQKLVDSIVLAKKPTFGRRPIRPDSSTLCLRDVECAKDAELSAWAILNKVNRDNKAHEILVIPRALCINTNPDGALVDLVFYTYTTK